MLSFTEENYLKALLKVSFDTGNKEVGTNELANVLVVKPATVNDMLKKLKDKQLVDYKKYGKITLTTEGEKYAIEIIRKHRLWEKFLCDKFFRHRHRFESSTSNVWCNNHIIMLVG